MDRRSTRGGQTGRTCWREAEMTTSTFTKILKYKNTSTFTEIRKYTKRGNDDYHHFHRNTKIEKTPPFSQIYENTKKEAEITTSTFT